MGRGSGKSALPALLALAKAAHGVEIELAKLVRHDFDHIIVDEFIPLELGNHLIAQRRLGKFAPLTDQVAEYVEIGSRLHRDFERDFLSGANMKVLFCDEPFARDFLPTPKGPGGKYHPQFHNEERPVARPMKVDHKKVAKNRAAAKRAKKARRK